MTNSMTTRSPVRSVRRGSLHRSRKRAILPFMATPLSPLIAVLAQYRQDAPERARGQSAVDQDHPRSCNIGSGALLFAGGERIEVDEVRIVWMRIAIEVSAAMNVHQGLHTPGIQIVHMLMPQRDRQQHFWQPNHGERRNPAHLAALPPKQRIERVDQLPLDPWSWRLLQLRWRAQRDVCVARARAHRDAAQLPANQVGRRENLPTHRTHARGEPG